VRDVVCVCVCVCVCVLCVCVCEVLERFALTRGPRLASHTNICTHVHTRICTNTHGFTHKYIWLRYWARRFRCNTPQLYNALPYTAIYCNTLHHTAIHYNILQNTATYCNILQHLLPIVSCKVFLVLSRSRRFSWVCARVCVYS